MHGYIDNLCVYTSDNNAIVDKYGFDNAIELYKDKYGDMECLNMAVLAYTIRQEVITVYIEQLINELR